MRVFPPPAVPERVFGRRVPTRFRSRLLYFRNPAGVAAELLGWVEQEFAPDSADVERVVAQAPAVEVSDDDEREGESARQRRTLVMACIELREAVRETILRDRIGDALEEAGVSEFGSEGAPFDPHVHRAVGTRVTTEPALHNQVARVHHPGYVDGGTTVKVADVLVYRLDGSNGGG